MCGKTERKKFATKFRLNMNDVENCAIGVLSINKNCALVPFVSFFFLACFSGRTSVSVYDLFEGTEIA